MQEITSSQNPLIKDIKSLNRKRNRWKNRLFIVEGSKIIEEAIINGVRIKNILLSETFFESEEGRAFYNNIKNRDNMVKIKDSLFNSISDTENPQGIMAICEFNIRELAETYDLDNSVILFLDGLQDPGNMGTIIRTADAFNIDGVILGQGSVDPYNLKVVRATMGSIFRVPLYICDNSLESLRDLKTRGFNVLATSLDGSLIYESDFRGKIITIIGNEANGVSPEILEVADKCIKIPMPGNAESLNAGVAASIIMYEAMRSRKTNCD